MFSIRLFYTFMSSISLLATSSTNIAADDDSTQAKYAKINASIQRLSAQHSAQSITPIAVDGMVRVLVSTGEIVYMTEDGKHFFTGNLYSNQAETGVINMTENDQKIARKQLLKEDLHSQQAWVFPATSLKKATITVFTDVDCFYCQKMHSEIEEITDLGIEVRYLAFPRAGIGSPSYNDMVNAWCAKDPNDYMAEAKRRSRAKVARQAAPPDCDNPVWAHYLLSQKLSLQGTPSIILDDGTLWPGYLPAKALAQRLNIEL